MGVSVGRRRACWQTRIRRYLSESAHPAQEPAHLPFLRLGVPSAHQEPVLSARHGRSQPLGHEAREGAYYRRATGRPDPGLREALRHPLRQRNRSPGRKSRHGRRHSCSQFLAGIPRASPKLQIRPVHAGSGLLGDFSWSDQRSIQATMALEKEESFYSASEEAEELKGDKGIYVRRKSSTSADVKPKVILEHAGREGERVQSTSVVLEEEKPRPLARRKSQLGRDLQASISNSKPIPPLRTEDQVRDEVENNDSKMPSASTSARVGPEAADKVNGVGASAKISAGTIFVGDELYFLFCEKCHGHVQTVRHTVLGTSGLTLSPYYYSSSHLTSNRTQINRSTDTLWRQP